MARYKDRQTSFAKGELAPGMRGRTDLPAYAHGCRTLQNFFVTPHGGAANRSGTEHIVTLTGGYPTTCRLIPFVFSDSESCVVVVSVPSGGAGVINIMRYDEGDDEWGWIDGSGDVIAPDNHTTVKLAISYPCTAAQLSGIRYSQVGDVLVLVHPEIAPMELRRGTSSFTGWTLTTVSFEVPDFPAYGGVPIAVSWGTADSSHPDLPWTYKLTRIMQASSGRVYETVPSVMNHRSGVAVWDWIQQGQEGRPKQGVVPLATAYLTGDIVYYSPNAKWYRCTASDLVHLGLPTEYNIASPDMLPDYWEEVTQDELGITTFGNIAVYADMPFTITWDNRYYTPVNAASTDDVIIATRIYRGRDGRFGFVGETTGTRFDDEGQTPDFSYPPPAETNPFDVTVNSGSGGTTVLRTEEPSLVAHWNGRRFYASTVERPDWVWGSEVENYYNFDVVVQPKDTDSLSFRLGTNKLETIRALIPRRNLVLLTDSSEQIAGGAGTELMTPTSISAMPLSEHGSGELAPLVFGDVIVFMQRKGTFPRALVASNERGGFQPVDIHSNSRHLFTGHTIVDWCYAEDPYSIIWAVRDDGALLSCTFNLEQEMVAWSIHWMADGGLVENVCSIPEGVEDAVYFAVNRGGSRRIERMTSRTISDVRDACLLDAAVRYDGRNVTSTKTVAVTAGALGESVAVDVAGETVAGEKNGTTIRVWDSAGVAYDMKLTFQATTHYHGQLLDALASSIAATDDWATCINTLSGLGHLGGPDTEVKALVDGDVIESDSLDFNGSRVRFGCTAGSTEESTIWGAVVVVGLPYESDFESLDMAPERTRQKTVGTVHIDTEGSRGGYVGVTLDDLKEIPQRDVEDAYAAIPLQYESIKVNIPSRWNESGRVAFRQSAPLPITILGITREVEVGG